MAHFLKKLFPLQTSMDQLQMHITSAVHNTSWNVVYGHAMLSNPTEIVSLSDLQFDQKLWPIL